MVQKNLHLSAEMTEQQKEKKMPYWTVQLTVKKKVVKMLDWLAQMMDQ